MSALYRPGARINPQAEQIARQRALAGTVEAWFVAQGARLTAYHGCLWGQGYFVVPALYRAEVSVRYVHRQCRAPWGQDLDAGAQTEALVDAATLLAADGWAVTLVPNSPPHLLITQEPEKGA